MKLARIVAFTEYSRENIRAGLIGGTIIAALGAFFLVFPRFFVGEFLVHKSYDVPFRVRDFILKKSVIITNTVIVYMDDISHQQMKQSYNRGWDRRLHAEFVRRLQADGAKAIVLDIVFDEEREGDKEFAEVIRQTDNVILAADNIPGEGIRQFVVPSEALLDAASEKDINRKMDLLEAYKRHVGVDELTPDLDLIVRRHTYFAPDEQLYPMGWVAASMVGAPITKKTNGWDNIFGVNYYGPPREGVPSLSYFRMFDTNYLKPGFFKDKIVFIGADLLTGFSGQRKDAYQSPYPKKWIPIGKTGRYETRFIPGVEVQATMCLNLLRGDWLTTVSNANQFSLAVILGFLSTAALMLLRPARAALLGIGIIAFVVFIGLYSAIYRFTIFAWLVPVTQVALGTVSSVVFNGYRLQMQRKLLQQSVSMYVSPAVAAEVLSRPEMMKPGARKELLSIMFTDIADFTKMSEGMDSDTLAQLMNTYFEVGVNKCIYPNKGTVVKFIGDAIFSIWNAPIPLSDHRELACRAAILLRDSITDFEFSKPGQQVITRIGLHTGMASVGNFGSSNRVDFTAFGENVNLSSRMEGLNKYLGTRILATGEIIEPVQKLFTARFLGAFQLKGFVKAFRVYELIGGPDREEGTAALRTEFATGVQAFQARDFDTAELAFKRVLQMTPKDGPSKFYLSHINEYRVIPPAPGWKGEIELKEK